MCPAFFHLICRLVCFFLILVRSSWVFFTILWAFPEPSWYFHALYRWLLYCFHHSLQWWDYSLCCNKRKIKTGTFSHAVMHCEWDEKAAHQINMRERIQCHPNVLKFVQVNWARCFYIDIYINFVHSLSSKYTHVRKHAYTQLHTCKSFLQIKYKWTDPFAIEWQRRHSRNQNNFVYCYGFTVCMYVWNCFGLVFYNA